MFPAGSPSRRRGLKERLAGLADNIGQFAEAVGNVVSSAGELLIDTDLRRKGANYIVQEAAKNVNDIREGIEERAETLQQGAKARFGAGAQKVTGLLRNIERQIQDFQRQQQQRDLQAELEHHHKLPVDIQIGDQVLEDMPQEMRSRLWYVLLERPDLAQALMLCMQKHPSAASSASHGLATGSNSQHADGSPAEASTVPTANPGAAAAADHPQQAHPAGGLASSSPPPAAAGSQAGSHSQPSSPRLESPFAAYSASPDPQEHKGLEISPSAAAPHAVGNTSETGMEQPGEQPRAASAAGVDPAVQPTAVCGEDSCIPDIEELLLKQSTGVEVPVDTPAAGNGAPESSTAAVTCSTAAGRCAEVAVQEVRRASSPPVAASPWQQLHAGTSDNSSSSGSRSVSPGKPAAPNPWGEPAPAPTAAAQNSNRLGTAARQAAAGNHQAVAAAAGDQPAGPAAAGAAVADHARSTDEWEMVPSDVPAAAVGAGQLEAVDSLRALVQQMAQSESTESGRATQQAVMQAMIEVPWIEGEGIPQEIDEHGEYARLLAAGCGHIEDIIQRDVARTFPEHPLFSAQLQGQQRLLRLLKAYAAADPEVGYCQGMAFAAGVLLMYLPEEPAFRLYHRIMTSGPNLRRLYLPGLEPLKMELSRFELLLATHYPQLHQHLLDAGLPALLYAAQWVMTTFSCPFPLHVAARVLDILLQSDSDAILSQLGLAVMSQLQDQLLEMDDFEALITYLKVQPLSWPIHTHRMVINEALNSPATEAQLKSAAATVAAEASRLGRFSSFSNRRLTRIDTQGVRHQLAAGTLGPRTEAAAGAGDGAGYSNSSEGLTEQITQAQPAAERAQVQSQQQEGNTGNDLTTQAQGAGASIGLDELESTFLDLDLDMIMPTAVSDGGEEHQHRV